ncbi:hypothetical protein GS399_05355 [Pedobacter sp. HMF7647]|uniref:Cell wall anchor protein n=1 Tax=Hufsiella arboris TaxID=2695275 RepID=A0A7K1Y743_9SPHI|nr:hypothetical protein [Hufsiella arboris]MXV50392.1 hypothetical protein [Hufsiella arboris]
MKCKKLVKTYLKNSFLGVLMFTGSGAVAQTLGSSDGSNLEISSVEGLAGPNMMRQKNWLVRRGAGSDWFTTALHDGVNVDASFVTPGLDTRTWWERDPNHDIQSWGNAANTYLTLKGGNLGLGTADPQSMFTLRKYGSGISMSPGLNPYFGSFGLNREVNTGQIFNPAGNAFQINNGGPDKDLHIQVFNGSGALVNGDALVISGSTANIGIGTTSPSERLSVNGKIRAREIRVEAAPWPDYVFEQDRKLPSLSDLEQFIRLNKHLPSVPSADEVEKDGVELGKMNSVLLEKIEELTLYLIQQEKKSASQAELIGQLSERLKKLETKK